MTFKSPFCVKNHFFAEYRFLKGLFPHKYPNAKSRIAQLLIRKLGSFIRLRRVLLLRSDIRLMPSGIRFASLWANRISMKP